MMKLLEGVKVLDLTRFVSGPVCTMMLAEMGARVIKVERPTSPDENRELGPYKDGASLLYTSYNLSKEAIAVDTRKPEGIAILKELVKEVDVITENFRPGVMDKMGLSWETVHAINPRVIMASISGFGQDGPYRDRVCFDGIAQAMGGLIDSVYTSGGVRCTTGGNLGDVFTGVYCMGAISTALYNRSVTGQGMRIDVDMMSSILSLFSSKVADYEMNGVIHAPLGYAPVANYQTSDGWVRIDATSAGIFKRLAALIGDERLMDDKYMDAVTRVNEKDFLIEVIGQWVGGRSTKERCDILETAGIPVGVINDVKMICEDPHLKARQQIVPVYMDEIGREVPYVAMPFRVEGMEMVYKNAPAIGQDTERILADMLGYDKEKIAALREQGIIR